jgi:hypothetical protein
MALYRPVATVLVCSLLVMVCCALAGCAAAVIPSTTIHVGSVNTLLEGFGDCSAPTRTDFVLQPGLPLVVLVHGHHSSAQNFRALSEVFALHDQQTVCFRYDDRQSLTHSAMRLRDGLIHLAHTLHSREVMVFGHSQGGLIARASLAAPSAGDEVSHQPLPSGQYRLVTVSSPFGGIRAASNCGSIPYHIASLGVTVAICRAISGAKWNEIHPRARMVRDPDALDPMVREHLTIITDERDTCRRYSLDGTQCLQDDYVFSLTEQHNQRIELDRRVVANSIAAGHVEVMGARGEPKKLLETLQRHGFLRQTHPDDQPAVERLTAERAW